MEEDVLILLGVAFNLNLPLLTAWLLDHWLGDPAWLPHPVVAFGKAISFCEHRLNRGDSCFLKGAFVAVSLVLGVYVITLLLLRLAALFSPGMLLTVQILLIFYCLAGTTLVREVRMVFKAVDRSLEEGRMQVARIVGRDTSALSAQEVRTAALETLAENLSDGVVAPLFWYLLLGVPGMLAYKMVNTLDSMVGYLVLGVYVITLLLLRLAALFSPGMLLTVQILLIFYCLAGTTLVREVRMVFKAVDRSLEEGRMQVARIVGRDTSALSAQEVRTAALETLAENLSDGVVAPLFWYLLLGVPGMLAYKMVNTLDSMVGYKNERYRRFGCFAARLDDVANYIPARLTAFLMVLVSGRLSLFAFVGRYGSQHASPNSGYPEAALAGILDCRFGGPHNYFGEEVWKPYIGSNERPLKTEDMRVAVRINRRVEWWMVVAVIVTSTLASFCF